MAKIGPGMAADTEMEASADELAELLGGRVEPLGHPGPRPAPGGRYSAAAASAGSGLGGPAGSQSPSDRT
jgi:hypothetical protein